LTMRRQTGDAGKAVGAGQALDRPGQPARHDGGVVAGKAHSHGHGMNLRFFTFCHPPPPLGVDKGWIVTAAAGGRRGGRRIGSGGGGASHAASIAQRQRQVDKAEPGTIENLSPRRVSRSLT